MSCLSWKGMGEMEGKRHGGSFSRLAYSRTIWSLEGVVSSCELVYFGIMLSIPRAFNNALSPDIWLIIQPDRRRPPRHPPQWSVNGVRDLSMTRDCVHLTLEAVAPPIHSSQYEPLSRNADDFSSSVTEKDRRISPSRDRSKRPAFLC
jgi:hypothetical protein